MADMQGYEIVLHTFSNEPHNALRIFVKQSDGTSHYIDLTHEAVMSLEQDLNRIIDHWNREP